MFGDAKAQNVPAGSDFEGEPRRIRVYTIVLNGVIIEEDGEVSATGLKGLAGVWQRPAGNCHSRFMPLGHLCPAHRNAVSFGGLRLWLTGQEDGISNVGGLGGHCSGRVQLAGEERKERPISELCHKKTGFERTGIKELAI